MKTLFSTFGIIVAFGLLISATETTTKIHNQVIITGDDVTVVRHAIENGLKNDFIVVSMTAQSVSVNSTYASPNDKVVKGEIIVVMERNR